MGIMGLYILRHFHGVLPAMSFGKLATVVIFCCIGLMLIFPDMGEIASNIFIAIMSLVAINAGLRYYREHRKILRGELQV